MAAKLFLKHRPGIDGKPVVAPFINGWNVCDVPEKAWCDDTGRALVSAYELGWNRAVCEMSEHLRLVLAKDKTP
jgi:hypothetical protein